MLDTIEGPMIAAGKERFLDGRVLKEAIPPRLDGAAYLMGYLGELLLAAKVLRLMNLAHLPPTSWRLVYGSVKAKAYQLGIQESPEGYHNPVFWAELLVKLSERLADRNLKKRARKWLRDARVLRLLWSPDLRYGHARANASTVDEIEMLIVRLNTCRKG